MSSIRTRDLSAALAREFSVVAASLLGATPASTPDEAPIEPRWVVRVVVGGQALGSLFLALGDAEARALARLVMGLETDPPDAAVADTVLELAGQAASSLGQSAEGAGLSLSAEPAAPDDVTGTRATFALALGDWAGAVLVAGEVKTEDGAAATEARAARPAAAPAHAPAHGQAHHATAAPGGAPANLEVILDIDLPITVRFGATEMVLQMLTRLGPGSIIDLERSPDDPVDVLVSDKVVARGEVVVVAGNYGVRITEVVSTADRIRSMGA